MIKPLIRYALLMLFACAGAAWQCSAQTRTVVLTWQDTQNPQGTTWNAYGATGTCTSNPTFAKLNTSGPLTVLTYTDTGLVIGTTRCYYVTSVYGGSESGPSNQVQTVVIPYSPILQPPVVH